MSATNAAARAVAMTPKSVSPAVKNAAMGLAALGLVGVAIGFFAGNSAAGWIALLVATVLSLGLSVVGILISAIFELTGARWGMPYRRLAEASVGLMPISLLGLVVIVAGGSNYLPWADMHHLTGGKAVWLSRGFWDIRVLATVIVLDAVSLSFFYYSLRRDFCSSEVAEHFRGTIANLVGKNNADADAERARCSRRLAILAPIVGLVYAVTLTFIAVDLIMALEPDWFSTLFGAWYAIGHLFVGLALLAIASLGLKGQPVAVLFSELRQRDLATLMFAFVLVNVDFFWSQYLTIWYGNMPEETGYLIERTANPRLPWSTLSWFTLFAFFIIPFIFLLFRKVKSERPLLVGVALVMVVGIFMARFIEIAPPLLGLEEGAALADALIPLAAAALVFAGFLGVGLLSSATLLTKVPLVSVAALEEE